MTDKIKGLNETELKEFLNLHRLKTAINESLAHAMWTHANHAFAINEKTVDLFNRVKERMGTDWRENWHVNVTTGELIQPPAMPNNRNSVIDQKLRYVEKDD